MAGESSFDIVSKINQQELDNALNQTTKEVAQRYDLKGANADISYDGKEKITITAEAEINLNAVLDIFQSRAMKRNISLKFFDIGELKTGAKNTVYKEITVKNGISKEKAKIINEKIKASKLKVTTQIQDDALRVSSKSKDELQAVMQLLKGIDIDIDLQFNNFR